jgi:hypothetical protein
MVLRALEGAHHGFDELLGELGVGRGKGLDAAAAVGDHDRVSHGLCAEPVLVTGLDSEDVPGEVEGVDLAAAVTQELGGADDA